ncbi:uncharacterized protein CLIB1444_02S01706 [[Candida] jaroonii]|uniref:Uncharacterized protein n=1 Tax=[Candida] jaroonii TaxID=467808 RepID=A0ACA9Y2F8_9ASCO|nr:uncharacterized protein CLIB1444_02S01706 [[Candida] jaroonii]
MKVFISSLNVPIGYTTPSFPSLYWPLGHTSSKFSSSLLYYSADVWRFTVLWFLIAFSGVYVVAAFIASINYLIYSQRNNYGGKSCFVTILMIWCTYLTSGLFIATIGGSVVGLIISAIYKAGSMTMSTWIPFVWALVGVLYDISTSYSNSSMTL